MSQPIETNTFLFEIKRAASGVSDPGESLGDIVSLSDSARIKPKGQKGRKIKPSVRPLNDLIVANPRTGYLEITDMPGTRDEALVFCRSVFNSPMNAEDPHSGGRKFENEWMVDKTNLPQEVQDEFALKGATSITWAQAQISVYSKELGRYVQISDIVDARAFRRKGA